MCFQWAEVDMKCACDYSLMKSYLTLTGLSLQWQVGSSKNPKPQLRWPFPQICLCTEASSNQQLHTFFLFSVTVPIMPCLTPIGIRQEVLALACKGSTGSLHKCLGPDSVEAPVDCKPPLSPLGKGTEVTELDNGSLAACYHR